MASLPGINAGRDMRFGNNPAIRTISLGSDPVISIDNATRQFVIRGEGAIDNPAGISLVTTGCRIALSDGRMPNIMTLSANTGLSMAAGATLYLHSGIDINSTSDHTIRFTAGDSLSITAPSVTINGNPTNGGLVAAKGDLITSSGEAPATLAVGADGSVLVADSSAPAGLSWVPFSPPLAASPWADPPPASISEALTRIAQAVKSINGKSV
jgi:hypothetical protein